MKRWRALFCAVLLCGLCWTGLSVPVSAADEPAMMLYNGVELPEIPWDGDVYHSPYNPSAYGYAYMFIRGNSDGSYSLFAVNTPLVWDGTKVCPDLSYSTLWYRYCGWTCRSGDSSWTAGKIDAEVTNSIAYCVPSSGQTVIWTNHDILDQYNGTIYLAASTPIDSNGPTPFTGRMVFGSEQVLDDFVSFVLEVGELSDTTASFSYGYQLYSGGVELRSVLDDGTVTGSDNYLIHSTIANLDPETEYEIIYTLYANGEPTEITASTTFTTLASSGSGGDSDPDYSGQLDGIQQGIGDIQDSVYNVGSKVDDIQDTLTETKQEITSLPGKIASAIIDGIKSLFVPSEEDLTEIKDKYESMLSEKLGFIWQAFDLLTTFVGDLQTNLESGEAYEFNFPGVSVPINGEEFVFVPETPVSLENELMDVLRPVLGTIVSAVAVMAFVNMGHDYVLAIISGVSAFQFENRRKE